MKNYLINFRTKNINRMNMLNNAVLKGLMIFKKFNENK